MIHPYRRVSLILAIVVLLSTVVAPVGAQEQADPPLTEQSTYEAFWGVVLDYNAKQSATDAGSDTVGVGMARYFVAGERVNVYVTDTDTGDVETFSFRVLDDLTVVNLVPFEHPDATTRVDVSRATVEDIMVADDPLFRLNWHVFEGNITIRGTRGSYADKMMWTLMKAGTDEARTYLRLYYALNKYLYDDLTFDLWDSAT